MAEEISHSVGNVIKPQLMNSYFSEGLKPPTSKYMGVSINGGTPIAGWFIRENPIYKWMMNRGYPYFRKHPYGLLSMKYPLNIP